MEDVERKLTYVISAKGVEATAAQLKKLQVADYKNDYRGAVAALKNASPEDIARLNETKSQREGQREAMESQKRLLEAQVESDKITAEAEARAAKERQTAAREAEALAVEERRALRQRRERLRDDLRRRREAGIRGEADGGNLDAEERLRFRNTAGHGAGGGHGGGGGGGGENADGGDGALGSLNGAFGRGSTLGKLARVAAGGGAIFALSRGAEMLEQMTAKAAELNEQYQKGDITLKQGLGDLAREIPVIGQVAKAFDNVRGMISGEAAELKLTTDLAEAQSKAIDYQNKLVKEQRQSWKDTLFTLGQIDARLAAVGKTGANAAQVAEETRLAERKHALDEEARKKKEARDNDPAFLAAKKELSDIAGRKDANSEVRDAASKELAGVIAEHRRADAQDQAAVNAESQRDFIASEAETGEVRSELGKAWREKDWEDEKALAQRKADLAGETAKLSGQEAQAAIDETNRKMAENLEAIDARVQKKIDERRKAGDPSPDQIDKYQREGEADKQTEKAAAAVKVLQINRDESLRKMERDAQVENSIRRDRLADIDREIAAGNLQHETEKKNLELEEQFAARRMELTKRLADTHADAAVKTRAAAELAALPGSQAAAKAAQEGRDTENDRLRFLKLQAEAGSHGAEVAAKRLEIERQYTEETQRLKAIQEDASQSKARRDQAGEALGRIGASEAAALKAASGAFDPTPQIAGRVEAGRGGLNGLVQRAREMAFLNKPHLDPLGGGAGKDPVGKATAETAKGVEKTNGLLETLIKAILSRGGGKSVFG